MGATLEGGFEAEPEWAAVRERVDVELAAAGWTVTIRPLAADDERLDDEDDDLEGRFLSRVDMAAQVATMMFPAGYSLDVPAVEARYLVELIDLAINGDDDGENALRPIR